MIIEHKGTKTVSGGAVGVASDFAINNTAMAFKILSSKLYTDKILAPIRELACNAYDAHVAAGTPALPFEINLPTSFDPMFRIKDSGIGLDDEGIKTLYCRYFSSNKSASNEFVGAMGLGSKSPFAYTEGFTVISIFNKTKRTYDAHLSEEGIPEVLMLSEETTTDHNGLEVSFPVPPHDFYEFQNKARIATEFIEPRPIVNIKHFTFTDTEYVMKTDLWGIRKEPKTHQTNGVRAIQGMVAYAVGTIDDSKTSDAQKRIMQMPVDLFFQIGDLDVAASRETLDNTKRTVANVLSLVDEVYAGLVDELKAKLNTAQSSWEARLMLRQMHDSPLKEVVKAAEKAGDIWGIYDNFTLAKNKPTINEMDYEHLTIARFQQMKRRDKYAKYAKYATKNFLFKQKGSQVYQTAVQSISSGLQTRDILDVPFEVSPDMLFVLNDIKGGGEKYVHYLLQQDPDVTNNYPGIVEVYMLTTGSSKDDQAAMITDAAALVKEIGSPKVISMSALKALYGPFVDIPKPKYSTGLPRERKSVLSLKFKGKYSSFRGGDTYSFYTNWVRAQESEFGAVNYYFILTDNQKPTWGNTGDNTNGMWSTCETMVGFLKKVRDCGFYGLTPSTPVFGLKANSKLIGQPDWVNLGQHIEAHTKVLMSDVKQHEMSLFLGGNQASNQDMWLKVSSRKLIPLCSPARKFADDYAVVVRGYEDEKNKILIDILCFLMQHNLWKTTIKLPNFEKLEKELHTIYPLLAFIPDTRWEETRGRVLQRAVDYVALIDETNEAKDNIYITFETFEEENEHVSIS